MNVLVLGAAVSGRAAVRLARSLGHNVTVYDRRPEALVGLESGVRVIGSQWQPELLQGFDYVVTSPGFPEHAGPIPDVVAAGVPLVSEMEFAAAHLGKPYIAITGTNGKTTVTTVAADMLTASGVAAVAAGNVGTALSDVVADTAEVVVIEASSFQLRFIQRFHPKAAAILNIAPDHLDWHQDFDEYVAAKQRIFECQAGDDILVYDVDDSGARAAVTTAAARLIPVSGRERPPGGYGPAGSDLVIPGATLAKPDLDRAYTMDLVAAATVASHFGAAPEAIEQIIATFLPGEHRRSVVGRWDGVSWVNDSKATNPHAAIASVEAFPSVVLIAGGRNKGLDLAPIVAVPSVRVVIGMGEAANELEAATFPGRFHRAGDLSEAVAAADALAEDGDTVLLAPGCASFDMFDSYAERGEVFGRLVRRLKGKPDGN